MNADDYLRLKAAVQERKYARPSPYKTVPIEELRARLYCAHGCEFWASTLTGLHAHYKRDHGR